LALTPSGEAMLQRLRRPAALARERLLSVFEPEEGELFLRMLDKFTRAFNESTRVPLEAHRSKSRGVAAGEPGKDETEKSAPRAHRRGARTG
jgi:hypothetical protein